jgi:hypothetical protein
MPYDLVARTIESQEDSIDSVEGLVSLASRLRTSASATLEHIFNLGFIDEVARDGLRESLHWSRLEG